ncbi:MAG: CHAT domain-containing protein, partial [Okeania sp. SIO2H7]|nr:CHAT domain-containing protein [Okeania sp. SIO2H7]
PWEQFLKPDGDIVSSEIDTLVFVLDGDLKSLPMGALWDPQRQRYLLERYAIAVAPSLQLVQPQPLARPIRVLAAGSSDALDHPLTDNTFPALQGVREELMGIGRQVSTDTLLNESFTRPNLTEKLNAEPFDILHLATHGEFSSDPNRTFVMLSDAPLYATELDQLLRLNENLQSPIEMIVLSACQTATGDNRAALGLAGLTLRAGAQSALATLWPVEDQSASILMQEFYRQISTHPNISRAEALRRSQLNLWEEDTVHGKDWKTQSFWSPYVLVGNWL